MTVCLIKAQVIEFGNEATWSTQRDGGLVASYALPTVFYVPFLPRVHSKHRLEAKRGTHSTFVVVLI